MSLFLALRWRMAEPTLVKSPMSLDRRTGHSDWRFMVRKQPCCHFSSECILVRWHAQHFTPWYLHISTVPPVLEGSLWESLNYTLGSHVSLPCQVSGFPVPSITWLKDGTPIGQFWQHLFDLLVYFDCKFFIAFWRASQIECSPPREQPAVAVVHPREQAGAGAPRSGSWWALHMCGQEQWGTSTERLLTHSTR